MTHRLSPLWPLAAALLLTVPLAGCDSSDRVTEKISEKLAPRSSAPTQFQTADMVRAALPDHAAGNISKAPRDSDGRPLAHALLGKTLPDFSAPLSTGGAISRADLADQWTVIDIWGLWCSDCLVDAPYSHALQTALQQDPDVGFLSLHTPPSASRVNEAFGKWGSLEAWFDETGARFPVAIDADGAIADAFQNQWTPTYLLISPDLTVYAYRTDLSNGAENGVKDAVRQISELRGNYAREQADALAGAPPHAKERSPAPPTVISRAGVAGLSGQTAFGIWPLKQAFDGYDVRPSEDMFEGESYPIFEVLNDQGVVLQIQPDTTERWVDAVIALTDDFVGPQGEKIGVTRLGDIPATDLGACTFGYESYASTLFCSQDEIARFVRAFRLPSRYEGPNDALPDDMRREAILIEMRYLPDHPRPAQ